MLTSVLDWEMQETGYSEQNNRQTQSLKSGVTVLNCHSAFYSLRAL